MHVFWRYATWSAEYSYEAAGNITKIGNETFDYDLDGRLTSSKVEAQDRVTLVTQTFEYDAYGNQTKRVTSGTTKDLSTDPATNHLSVMNATCDGAGNLTSINPSGIATFTYVYDGLGMLMTEATGTPATVRVWNAYTADDERIMTYDTLTQASTMTVRDLSGHVLRRIDRASNGTIKGRDYVYRDGMMLAEYDPATSSSEHFTLDHLGTPRVITDGAGVKIGYHSYQPFGEEMTTGNNAAQEGEPKKFTGHERDAALAAGDTWALDYMHARYYSSSTGRFLSVDPALDVKKVLPNPQAWNRYSYVLNDPMRFTDPTGRELHASDYLTAVWDATKMTADDIGYGVSHSALTVMSGIMNDSPSEVARGSGMLFVEGATSGVLSANVSRLTMGFTSRANLLAHFEKHGAEMGFQMAESYGAAARQLISSAGKDGVQSFVRKVGDSYVYNAATKEFAVANKSGEIVTYFKANARYWAGQVRKLQDVVTTTAASQ